MKNQNVQPILQEAKKLQKDFKKLVENSQEADLFGEGKLFSDEDLAAVQGAQAMTDGLVAKLETAAAE